MATKQNRLVMRLSPDMDEWIGRQAAIEELDKSAWVRTQLARIRRGEGIEPTHLPRAAQLTVPEDAQQDQPSEVHIDTDALVANALEHAQSQGLTEPEEQANPVPQGGVKALRRPISTMAGGNHAAIEKFLR